MEELITIDGRQYLLSYDQPIGPEQISYAIEEIKNMYRCKTCGHVEKVSSGRSY